MEAEIDPLRFWNLTYGEIADIIKGYHKRVQWQASLAYTIGALHGRALSAAFGSGSFPTLREAFPSLFDDIPEPEEKPDWQIMQERIAAHANDWKRNGGETAQ